MSKYLTKKSNNNPWLIYSSTRTIKLSMSKNLNSCTMFATPIGTIVKCFWASPYSDFSNNLRTYLVEPAEKTSQLN